MKPQDLAPFEEAFLSSYRSALSHTDEDRRRAELVRLRDDYGASEYQRMERLAKASEVRA